MHYAFCESHLYLEYQLRFFFPGSEWEIGGITCHREVVEFIGGTFSFLLSFSLYIFPSASHLFKNNQLLSCQLWLKIDCHLCRVPRPGKSPVAPPQPLSINCNKRRRHQEPEKGLTEAKGPVHGVRRRSNLCERKRRLTFKTSHKQLDTAAARPRAKTPAGTSLDNIEVTTRGRPQFARKGAAEEQRGFNSTAFDSWNLDGELARANVGVAPP